MIRLGATPKNIFVLGKHYSECPSVVKEMTALGLNYHPCSTQTGLGRFSQAFTQDINWLWHEVVSHLRNNFKKVMILDHGGYALSFIPNIVTKNYKVIGIEKTSLVFHMDKLRFYQR